MFKLQKISYISKNKICGGDFDKIKTGYLRIQEISFITELEEFTLPLSGKTINQKYSTVELNNGTVIYITEDTFNLLSKL